MSLLYRKVFATPISTHKYFLLVYAGMPTILNIHLHRRFAFIPFSPEGFGADLFSKSTPSRHVKNNSLRYRRNALTCKSYARNPDDAVSPGRLFSDDE
jgi:hypothetical protein